MKYLLIFCCCLMGSISVQGISYIEISSKDLDPCKWQTANEFIQAFEDGSMEQMAFFLNEKTRYKLSKIKKHSEELKGQVGGMLSYEHDDVSYYKRIYYTYVKKKKKYLFELTLFFKEENPYVFKQIKVATRITMPKKLRKLLHKLNRASKEEGYKIVTQLAPQPPPICSMQLRVDKKRAKVYIEPIFYDSRYNTLNVEHLNESKFLIHLHLNNKDSIHLPPELFELERLEKLTINVRTKKPLNKVPKELFEFKTLKSLRLFVSDATTFTLPSAIHKLTDLEEFTIRSYGLVVLPPELLQLKQLKVFRFEVRATNKSSREIVDKIELNTVKSLN
ncbi:MAG: hypothetical protein AAF990_04270 [Bacteroidota bacterium]